MIHLGIIGRGRLIPPRQSGGLRDPQLRVRYCLSLRLGTSTRAEPKWGAGEGSRQLGSGEKEGEGMYGWRGESPVAGLGVGVARCGYAIDLPPPVARLLAGCIQAPARSI